MKPISIKSVAGASRILLTNTEEETYSQNIIGMLRWFDEILTLPNIDVLDATYSVTINSKDANYFNDTSVKNDTNMVLKNVPCRKDNLILTPKVI